MMWGTSMSSKMITLMNDMLDEENTLDELKEGSGIVSDKQLINALLKVLDNEIANNTYDEMLNDETGVKVICNHLMDFFIEKRKCDLESVVLRLLMTESCINKILTKLHLERKANNDNVFLDEKTYWRTTRKMVHDLIAYAKLNIEEKDVVFNKNYELLTNVVYNIKSIALLQEMNKRMPKIFGEIDEKGITFFANLMKYYLDIANDSQTTFDDFVYYDAVLDIFLNNKFARKEKHFQLSVYSTIKKLKDNEEMDKNSRKQRRIFLEHVIRKIRDENNYVQNMNELEKKYSCSIHPSKSDSDEINAIFNNNQTKPLNLTHKDIITIDPAKSLEIDDGLSLEMINNNYLLGIHIADVSNYVPYNSHNDLTALSRGETIYQNNTVIRSMLPDDIILNKCSLLPNNDRYVVSCFLEIEPDGHILRHNFVKGVVRTRSGLCLLSNEVNRILNKGSDNKKVLTILSNIQKLFNQDLFKNFTTGELNNCYDDSQIFTFIDRDMELNMMSKKKGISVGASEAVTIVHKSMLLNNEMAALDAKENDIPFIYRTHECIPLEEIFSKHPILESLVNRACSSKRNEMFKAVIRGSFSQAKYSIEPLPHKSLNFFTYAHTTSPLRRYSDLANQRLIKAALIDKSLKGKDIYKVEKALIEIINKLNNSNMIIDQYLNDYARIKK